MSDKNTIELEPSDLSADLPPEVNPGNPSCNWIKRIVCALFIIVILTGLGVGSHKWKKGSDRAGCIMNIRNVQQCVRGFQGMNNLGSGAPIDWEQIFMGPDAFMPEPVCPAGGTYTFSRFHPGVGVLACTCSLAKSHAHEPSGYHTW